MTTFLVISNFSIVAYSQSLRVAKGLAKRFDNAPIVEVRLMWTFTGPVAIRENFYICAKGSRVYRMYSSSEYYKALSIDLVPRI